MLSITKVLISDCRFVCNLRNECAEKFLHDSSIFTYEQVLEWFTDLHPEYYILWMENERIGYFRTSNYSEKNRSIYIGLDLHADYRGKGIGFSAYKKFIPFIFSKYNLNKISLEVLSTNISAIALYKKLGFVTEGIKRLDVCKNGIFIDSIMMSMLLSEMKSNRIYDI